jgi:hypothetical protein
MGHQSVPGQAPYHHAQQQQHTSAPYASYPSAHQGYAPQVSHPGEMQMMAHTPHPQAQMMQNEQGQHIVYHMQPNMKVEH